MSDKALRKLSAVPEEKTADQYLTFTLGNELFGVPIGHIKEIIEYSELTTVPMMPAAVRGVINLRGSVVPVLDLELRFGRPASAIGRRSCIVIFESHSGVEQEDEEEAGQYLGMIVDAVNEVLEISAGDMEPAPSFGATVHTDFIRAMGKVDGRFVIILDVAQVLALDGIAQLAGATAALPVAEAVAA